MGATRPTRCEGGYTCTCAGPSAHGRPLVAVLWRHFDADTDSDGDTGPVAIPSDAEADLNAIADYGRSGGLQWNC